MGFITGTEMLDNARQIQKRLAAHPMGRFHEFAGFPGMRALEEKYLLVDEVKKKFDGAVGL